MNNGKNRLNIAIAAFVIGIMVLSLLPLDVSADFGECPNTQGGVPGNRQNDNPGLGGFGAAGFGPINAANDGTTIDPSDSVTHATLATTVHDFSGATPAGEPEAVFDNGNWYMGNMGTFLDGFTIDSDVTIFVDKWDSAKAGGYASSVTDTVLVASHTFPAFDLEMVPDVWLTATTGADATLNWDGVDSGIGVTGYMVYRASSNDTTNEGWGAGYSAWTALTTDVNTTFVSHTGTGNHQYVDSTGSGGTSYYYAVTCVFAGVTTTPSAGTWNIESLYRGKGSAMFTFGGDPPPSKIIEIRSTSGIQVLSLPTNNMAGITTAKSLAEKIEAETDMQVLTISDFEKGWDDFLYRDSNGNMLSTPLQTASDFALSIGEGYMVSLRSAGGSDFEWEITNLWDNATTAVSIDLDAGWNNVGIPYDGSGNYDTPDDLTGGSIDDAAAWVGGSWADYTSPSWSDVQQQKAGGLTQVFGDNQNAHGFFVKASADYTWNQANALP